MKRKISMTLLSLFTALGVFLGFENFRNSTVEPVFSDSQTLVDVKEVDWNNIDYSFEKEFTPNINEMGVPQDGYLLLALYKTNISQSVYYTQNLLTANVQGCNVGDYILINDIAAKNVTNVVIYCFPTDGIYIYVPKTSITFTEEHEYLNIKVKEGMSIDGSAKTVATEFEYRGLLGSFGNWLINPGPIQKIKGEFSRFDWNNRDYSFTLNQSWCGELNPNGSPTNGYCLLAFFNEEGKTYQESIIGDTCMTGRGVIGQGLNADTKIKINGVNMVDVPGSICYIFPQYGLFFYLPKDSLTYNETYICPTITLEKGLHFNNVYLNPITFEFRGELGQQNCWAYIKEASEYNHFEFTGVASEWNNTAADATHNNTILGFGVFDQNFLKNDKVADGNNLVDIYSDCGKKIKINGLPLREIDETTVSYLHGKNYLYIAMPTSSLIPSNGYKIVTLHIDANTIFYDTMLPEVNLYLFNDKWTTKKPDAPEDNEYIGAFSFTDVFGSENLGLDNDTTLISGTKQSSLNTFGFNFDYKLCNENTYFSLYLMGNKNQCGIKVNFNKNVITLNDSTVDNKLLGSTELISFAYDEWYSLFVYSRYVGNVLTIYVAIDDIVYIKAEGVVFSNEDNIGDTFSAVLGDGKVGFKNSTLGADNKKPVITYSGKSVYSVVTGSNKIDFSDKCTAYDKKDGDVTKTLQITWPVDSLTDNKINKGVWNVVISAKDKSNNIAEFVVTVIGADKLDVTVTFDGKNSTSYRVGDHISPIAEPTKDEQNKTYRFIGWYYNGKLWDFENDFILCDMNLESKFQETITDYCVTFIVEGLKDLNTFTLYFSYNTSLTIKTFDRDGYSLKGFVNNKEVTSFKVTADMEVKLVYTSTASQEDDSGCGGSLIAGTSLFSIISGATFILLSLKKKEGGNIHE